jgi:acylglycerol lipase
MKHSEGFFEDAHSDKHYYQYWLPDGPPKAVLLVVHGLAEHSGRYGNLVGHFVPLGYAVYGIDHIGHGKSDGTRAYVDRFEDFLEPLRTYYGMVREWQRGRPVFLIGHSMGGLIAAAHLLENQEDLKGAVLSGPSVKIPDNISQAVIFIGKVLSALIPKAGILALALDPSGVSRDPAVVRAYVDDPLVHTGKITARLGAELLKTMRHVAAEAGRIRLPILILQGGADKLVDPAGARMLYDLVGSTDKTLKVYDGLYHEVYNEPERQQVLHDVQAWLDRHLPS